jgi:L-threonylcarbamoyladenylate synthase
VAIPTETVYGLGANALDEDAVRRVFTAKGRPADDPLIVHVAERWPLERTFADVHPTVRQLAQRFWPGPLTLIGPKADDIAPSVTSGGPSVAVRCPSHPVAAAIIAAADVPVAAPSANRFSYVSPTSADHVLADLGNEIDLVIDAGRTTHGIESTVVAVEGDRLVVLRPGAVTLEDLRHAAGEGVEVIEAERAAGPRPVSPGRLELHYSPATPAVAAIAGCADPSLSLAAAGRRCAYLGFADRPPRLPEGWRFIALSSTDDLAAGAFDLYEVLREIDEGGVTDLVVFELTGAPGIGRAIDDRLVRAAGGRVARTSGDLADAIGATGRP